MEPKDQELVIRIRRDVLAAVAMHAMLSRRSQGTKELVNDAYEIADAMIKTGGDLS